MPTNIVKGQELTMIFVEGNEKGLSLNGTDMIYVVLDELEDMYWYSNIIYLLKNSSCPNHLNDHMRKALILNSTNGCLIQDSVGWRNPNGLILRCVNKEESKRLMEELHSRYSSVHYAACTTMHKTFRPSYY